MKLISGGGDEGLRLMIRMIFITDLSDDYFLNHLVYKMQQWENRYIRLFT